MSCRNCGGEFSAERAELGYDYCTKPECVEACLEPLNVVAVSVNKAADQNSLAAFGDTRTQTVGVLSRIQEVLKGMGLGMGDVVKMQVFLVGDPGKNGKADIAGFMEGYTQFFGGPQPNLPARAVVQVAGLSNAGWLVEIEVVAAKK